MLSVNMIDNLNTQQFIVSLAQDAIRNDTVAQLLQRRQEYDEREHNRALNEFRALHQQPSGQSIEQKKFFNQSRKDFVLNFNRRMGFK
jgi:hypothetical protein